jgi:hypothetical protein
MHQEYWFRTYQELTPIVDPAEHLEFCVPAAQFFSLVPSYLDSVTLDGDIPRALIH